MLPEGPRTPDSVALECGWCGDVAFESPDGWFQEDAGEACLSCGMPGHVSLDEDRAYWTTEDTDENVAAWLVANPDKAAEYG